MTRQNEWLKRAVILLMLAIAIFLLWKKLAVDRKDYVAILPPAFAIALILWAVVDWVRGAKAKRL